MPYENFGSLLLFSTSANKFLQVVISNIPCKERFSESISWASSLILVKKLVCEGKCILMTRESIMNVI
jgi:hypothetical protein